MKQVRAYLWVVALCVCSSRGQLAKPRTVLPENEDHDERRNQSPRVVGAHGVELDVDERCRVLDERKVCQHHAHAMEPPLHYLGDVMHHGFGAGFPEEGAGPGPVGDHLPRVRSPLRRLRRLALAPVSVLPGCSRFGSGLFG